MKKHILAGLSSLLFPMSMYGLPSNTGSYQRSYLRASINAGKALRLSGRTPSFETPPMTTAGVAQPDIFMGNPTRELVIIDAAVPEKHAFHAQIRPGVDVVELTADHDGLAQLQRVLSEYSNLQAVHIVSHADAGVLRLGNSRINAATVYDNLDTFASINGAIKPNGDILFYGCNLAAGGDGAEFLDILAANTHADVAASDDVTGNSEQGGDWELEIHKGRIETQQPFSEIALKDFRSVLLDQTITMDGFPLNYGHPKTATYGGYTARLSLDDGDPDNNSMNCINGYGYGPQCIVDYSGGSTGDKKLYFDFTGGEKFDVTSFYLYTAFYVDQNLRISSDNGDTIDHLVDGDGTGDTIALNWTGITRITIEKVDSSDIEFLRIDDIVLTNIGPAIDSDGTLTAGFAGEATGLNTTVDTVGEAVDMLDFTITDGGGGDGLAMTASQIIVNVSGTSTDAERGQVTWRLNGPDVSNEPGTYNAGSDTITFSGLSISVADSGNETYTVNAYYNTTTNLTEDHTFILSVDGDTNVTVGGSGTQMSAGQSAVTNGAGATIDIVATQLAFTTQPAGSVSGIALTTQPVVAARDAFGNTDVDFTETITLTEASAGSLTSNTQAATNGVATFTSLIYTATADQESFTLTANDQDGVGSNLPTVDANAVTSDVVATQLVFDTQPAPTTIAGNQSTIFTTVPVVSARDPNDIVDTGYSTGITLSEVNGPGSAALSVTDDEDGGSPLTVTITPSSGVSTFTGLQINYTLSSSSNETFNLRASSGGLTTADSDQFTAVANNPPTDIVLNDNEITQSSTGAAAVVGTLNTTDADGGDTHTYSLVANGASGNGSCGAAGDDDNASFQIDNVNDELETDGSLSPGSYDVCIQTSDGAASYQKTFSITVVDDVVPTVSSVSVPANATYITGQDLDFTVNTNENVTVNTTGGTPQISLTIGATPRQAAYVSGSGTSALVFRYTVQSGDLDTDGIALGTLSANGGSLQDGGNNNLNTTLNSVGSTADVLVDGIAPTISSVSVPANNTYTAGQNLDFTVNTDENVTVNTGGGTPQIALTVGATTRQAAYVSGSGTSALLFRYTVQAGDNDSDGIAVGSLSANGGTLQDGAGNNLDTTLNSVGSTANVLVDAAAPTVSSVSVPSNGSYTAGQNLDFTVNTNENVTVNTTGGTPQISLTIGATTRQAVYLSGSGTTALVFRYTVQAGDNDTDGIAVGTLSANGGTLQDGAGNDMDATLNSVGSTTGLLVDAVVPTVSSVGVPANGSYSTGQNLDFTVNTNENVTVNTTGGTPQIALTIGATSRQAAYLSGSGTSALVFRYTVQAGDVDTDGIAVAASIDANGGTLQDGAGNDITLTLNSVGSTAAVLVDANAPVNTLPAAQITDSVTQLVFSSGNGNAISVTDDGSLTVVISIGSGTLTASTGGSAGISNNGTGTVTITGTAAEVNVALEGLTYTPDGAGARTLNIQSTDSAGNVDDDDLDITVDAATLLVTSNLDTGDDETAAGSFAADQADGSGLSIREALNWARAGDTITFDLDSGTAGNQGGSITLNGNQLVVAYSNLAIDGDLDDDGSADVTISANNASRVMSVNGSLSGIVLSGLTLTQGNIIGGGGGLALGNSVSITLRDSNITNNTTSGTGGAGIYGNGVTLTVINSTVSGNNSDSFGGGMRLVGASVLNLVNSTISGNTTTGASQHGGGIQYAGPTLTIINSTISGNAVTGANADGGGLRITSGTSYIYNTTIVGNAATNVGGGVSANGTTDNFINTVVAGNTAGAGATAAIGGSPLATGGADNDAGGTIEVATNSYFGTTATITTDNNSLNNQGTGNLFLDNLGNYDGNPVQTHFPQTGSALLEAGSNAALPPDTFDLDGDSNTAEALPIDANGNPRVSNIVDIGAVEGDVPPAVTSVGVPANGTYIAGQNLDFTVNTDENITVNTAGGTPRIALTIGATTRYASYLSGSGTTAVVFRYTVQAGDNDSDGIAVTAALEPNGGTLRNGGDEDLNTALNSVGSTASVLVDAVAPTVTDANISISGATGTGGAFRTGNTVTATWNNTAGGDNNNDINSVTVDFSQFGGGSVAATESSDTWTATYTIISGSIDTTNRNVSVTATDNAGNGTTTADATNATVDNAAPTVTDGNIALSGGSGGTFIVGHTVSVLWNSSAGGDNNGDIGSVTVDFTEFGGGAAVAATDTGGGFWSADYTIAAGAITGMNRNVSVTATDDAGNSTTETDTTNATVDNTEPTVTDANIAISGATGTGGAYKLGDTVTATWDNTAGGDSNGDVDLVRIDFAQFGGGLETATESGGVWTATSTIFAGTIDATNRNVSVLVEDIAGNSTTTADTTNATVDNIVPTVTDANISISGATGTGGAYKIGDTITATWNNTAGGDNNTDTLDSVTVNFGQFGGGIVAATETAGTWTATYTLVAGTIDDTNRNVSVTVTDNAGNSSGLITDSANATVDNEIAVDSVIHPVDATYLAGQHLNFMVNYQEAMSVSGTPRLELTVGADTRYADYVSGTNPLLFRYVAQAGDNDSDGVVLNSEMDLNGGAILDNAGNDGDLTVGAAGLTAVLVDTQAPSVTSVTLPANGAYIIGQNLDFTVNYDEAVIASGSMPRLALTIGSTLRHADYISGSGTNALVFRHTVQAGDIDSDGISLDPALDLNGGTLRDAGGNNASTDLGANDLSGVLVDAQAPSITSVTLPADNIYLSGENLDFTVNYDEAVTVNTAGGTPRLALTVGSTTRFATYTAGSGTNALLFRYTAQNGDNDNDGIALNTTVDVNGGSVRDAAGNNADTGLGAIGSLAGVLVDTQAPSISSVSLPADDSYREGRNLDFTVNFDETLTVNTAGGTPRLELTVGAAARYADYVSGSGSAALLFRYTVQAGDTDSDGIALDATLQSNGGTLRDVASNNAGTDLGTIGSLAGVLVDTQAPSITSVNLPANALYTTDQDLDFTVNYDENVTVDTAGGAPRLALTIGAATQYAGYVSGSGTSALLFRYTVQDGDSDGDGIELNAMLDANGGTLRDTAGNDAGTDLGANDLSGVLVDALDTDGDGVSDVQEGIDGTDPNDPDDYLDDTAPVVTAPADLVIDATGLYTPVTLRQLLGLAPAATDEEVQQAQAALAADNIDGADCCNTQAQGLENNRILLQPGQTQIVWQGSDRKGNNGQAVQNVNVRPLVSVGKDQTGVEGNSVDFRVILNGLSPFYPLEVPFAIDTAAGSTDNTDHDLVDGTVTFNAGETEASITINLIDDMLPEGDETLVVRLDDLTDDSEDLAGGYDPFNINDINSGAVTQQTITITESNVAPDVALNIQQNAVNVALVANNGGDVTVTANVTDPNAGDTHSYNWSGTDSQLTDTDGDVTDATFVFDPALLSAGVHTVQVSVTDSGSASVTRLLHFSVVAEAPVLDPLDDTDGDGIDDVTEGIADSDGDGIPDYLDNIAAGNVLPESVDVTDAYLIECEPGVRCRLGSNALPGGGVWISTGDLPEDTLYTNIGGLFDFEIHELPVAGQSTRVVIPQIAAIPADAAYRKFSNDQWFTFVEDASNTLHSAQGEAGFCPPPGDASWEPGLMEGYLCVQLTLEDGGANDTDGQANGSIADPGGVGQPVAVTPPSSSWTISGSTRGGGGALGLPAGLALLLLVLMRNGRRAATLCGLLAALLASATQAQEGETPIADEAAAESREDTGETSSRWQRLLDSFAEKGYLTLGLYQAEGDQSRGDFVGGMANDGVTLAVQGYDVSRTAYQLSLGYRYLPGMAVEFGYLDLGDVDFAFTATAANAAVLSNALSQNLPVSSDGWLLSHRFDYMFGDWRASGDVGLYFWDGKASINDPAIDADIKDGTDPLIGLQVAYPLTEGLELAVQYRRILFDDQNVSLWGGALSWNF